MGISQAVRRRFENIWSHGDDDDFAPEDNDANDAAAERDHDASYSSTTYPSFKSPASHVPTHGGGSSSSSRRLRPVAAPLRSREKNIYTLKPKNQDEAAIAADYLKTGSAVVINLEDVDRLHSVRIIDFMSGVCYGLDNQGHAMKLGDTIFLFTPGDFEISSDEADYGENVEHFFAEVTPLGLTASGAKAGGTNEASGAAGGSTAPSGALGSPSFPSVERRTWDR